jgi:cell division ATPase FtsA
MFKSSNEFSLHIEQMVKDRKLNHMDAVLEYCKENYIEPDDVSSLINKSLRDKIEMNFRDLNYLPKQAQLDI